MAYAAVSKTVVFTDVWVQLPPSAFIICLLLQPTDAQKVFAFLKKQIHE